MGEQGCDIIDDLCMPHACKRLLPYMKAICQSQTSNAVCDIGAVFRRHHLSRVRAVLRETGQGHLSWRRQGNLRWGRATLDGAGQGKLKQGRAE